MASHLEEHLAWEMEPVLLSGDGHSATGRRGRLWTAWAWVKEDEKLEGLCDLCTSGPISTWV